MSKIAFVHDPDPFTVSGGAELSSREVIREGIKRGHDLDLYTAENIHTLKDDNPDFIIFSNTIRFRKEDIEEVMIGNRYLLYLHDVYPPCKWQLFYQKQDKCQYCCEEWVDVFRNASTIVWLSPLHRQKYLELFQETYPELEEKSYYCFPSPVKTEGFECDEKKNLGQALAVNSLYRFKGAERVIEYAKENQEMKFIFIGDDPEGFVRKLPENCEYRGRVSQSQIQKLFKESEYFVHFPNLEPFGRTVAEAVAAGCKLIVNENVGALSYDGAFENGRIDRAWFKSLKDSPKGLWNHIEEVMG